MSAIDRFDSNVFPKHILKSKVRDILIQARKTLFCHVIVKNYLCNVFRKFFRSSKRREGAKPNKIHPS